MNISYVLGILLAISFLWALWSLKKESKKPRELHHAREDLKREKILYKA